jgi:hypothetical protein
LTVAVASGLAATLTVSPAATAAEDTAAIPVSLISDEGDVVAGRDIGVFAEIATTSGAGEPEIRYELLETLATTSRGLAEVSPRSVDRASELAGDDPTLLLFSAGPEGLLMHYVDPDADPVDGVDHAATRAGRGAQGPARQVLRLGAPSSADGDTLFAASSTSSPCGPTGGPSLRATSTYTRRWVPFQRTQTLGKTRATYSWETTSNTKIDVATDGKFGAAKVGLAASSTNTTSGGWSSALPTNTSRRVDADWEYRRHDIWCTPLTGPQYYSGQWQWRPHRWTAGNRNVNSQPALTCKSGTRVKISNTTWVAQSTTVDYSGYFSIAGVSLKSQQKNSSSHKLSFQPTTSTGAHLCGTTDYPVSSAQVRETT